MTLMLRRQRREGQEFEASLIISQEGRGGEKGGRRGKRV